MRNSLAILSILTVFGAASAFAHDHDQEAAKSGTVRAAAQGVKSACSADIQKFCKDVTQGEGRIAACLKSKEDQLSDPCNKARMTLSETISKKMDKAKVAFRKECGSDVQKFCSDIPSGGGKVMDCLSSHENDLSSSCKGFQAKIHKKMEDSVG